MTDPIINPANEFETRAAKVNTMRAMGLAPFAQRFDRTHTSASVIVQVAKTEPRHLESILEQSAPSVRIAGRVILKRSMGGLIFAKLQDATGEIQLMFSKKRCLIIDAQGNSCSTLEADPKLYPDGYSAFKYGEKMLDLADFIGVSGEPFYTQK